MSNKKNILQLKYLQGLKHMVGSHQEKKAKQRIKEENDYFDHFVKTGEVKPLPDKKLSFSSQAVCRSIRIGNSIHQQTVRKLFMPKNHKRKTRI